VLSGFSTGSRSLDFSSFPHFGFSHISSISQSSFPSPSLPRTNFSVACSPFSLLTVILFAAITSTFAVGLDTLFYNPFASLETIVQHPVITPLNNILYNSKTSNVAQHGLHLRYSHFLFNLPQLLGPAFVSLLLNLSTRLLGSLPFLSSFSGIAILSVIAHQEARFLIPTVPLLLAVTPLPGNLFFKRIWIVIWILFNTLYGLSIGSYHQAGIIPAQAFLASYTNASSVVFWKTYNPPTWLFGAMNDSLNTTALMGAPIPTLINTLIPLGTCAGEEEKDKGESFLAAPLSAPKLDDIIDNAALPFRLDMVWSTKRHLNMDDLGFGDDGIVETVKRVVGRRGLGVWKVQQRNCSNDRRKKRNLFNDW
jgi:phosphatidylinositol glycan class Z